MKQIIRICFSAISNDNSSKKGMKILTPPQMLQKLPAALAQVKSGNTSGNVLNKIRYFFQNCFNCCSLYQANLKTYMK